MSDRPTPSLKPKPISLTLLRRHFEVLIDRVGAGEEFVVTRRSKPIALLGPLSPEQRQPHANRPADPEAPASERPR